MLNSGWPCKEVHVPWSAVFSPHSRCSLVLILYCVPSCHHNWVFLPLLCFCRTKPDYVFHFHYQYCMYRTGALVVSSSTLLMPALAAAAKLVTGVLYVPITQVCHLWLQMLSIVLCKHSVWSYRCTGPATLTVAIQHCCGCWAMSHVVTYTHSSCCSRLW